MTGISWIVTPTLAAVAMDTGARGSDGQLIGEESKGLYVPHCGILVCGTGVGLTTHYLCLSMAVNNWCTEYADLDHQGRDRIKEAYAPARDHAIGGDTSLRGLTEKELDQKLSTQIFAFGFDPKAGTIRGTRYRSLNDFEQEPLEGFGSHPDMSGPWTLSDHAGKTVLEVVRRMHVRYPDGVWGKVIAYVINAKTTPTKVEVQTFPIQ